MPLDQGRGDSSSFVALVVEHNARIPLRDGIETSIDIWRPSQTRPLPTILIRTPYGKEVHFHMSPIDPRAAISRGYNMVIQDVRGRGASEGNFKPFIQERQDGYDTIEWISVQPWSDGRVVMTGPSYVGATQWLAADAHPPALKAIAPLNSTDSFGNGFAFTNGVREHGFLTSWISAALAPKELLRPDAIDTADSNPMSLISLLSEVEKWFATNADDGYWDEVSVGSKRSEIDIPVLSVTGWYDTFLRGALHAHQSRQEPRDRIIIGVWGHDNYFSHLVGPRNLGFAGSGDALGLGEIVLDFFDDALAHRASSLPPVKAFVLGAKVWRDFDVWPPRETSVLNFPLAAGTIEIDPTNMPHSSGGRGLRVGEPNGGWGPTDQSGLLNRPDALVTMVKRPDSNLTLAGPAWVSLSVDESQNSRLWVALLCSHSSGGAFEVIADGVTRQNKPESHIEIPLGDILIDLAAEVELVLIILGGYFPRWDPAIDGGPQTVRSPSTLNLTALQSRNFNSTTQPMEE